MKVKYKKLLNSLIIMTLVFPAQLWSVEVTVELANKASRGINLRQRGDSIKTAMGRLLPGTKMTINIKDEAFKKRFGNPKNMSKVQKEKAFIQWIKEAGKLQEFSRSGKRDFFANVKLTEDAKTKSGKVLKKGLKGQVAIRYLGRMEGLKLINITETSMYEDESSNGDDTFNSLDDKINPDVRNRDNRKPGSGGFGAGVNDNQKYNGSNGSHSIGVCGNKGCQKTRVGELCNSLSGILEEISTLDRRRAKNVMKGQVIRNFNRYCQGSFKEFAKMVVKNSRAQGIPPELMLSIVTQETEGICNEKPVDEWNNTVSAGVFGVNMTRAQWENDPLNRLELGLNSSLKILKDKYNNANRERFNSETYKGRDWSDFSPEEKDRWRLALMGYNGGEAHVEQQKQDLRDINKNLNVGLNIYSFESHRVAAFVPMLDKNYKFYNDGSKKKKGEKGEVIYDNDRGSLEDFDEIFSAPLPKAKGELWRRAPYFSLINVRYVIDTTISDGDRRSHADEWLDYIDQNDF